MQVSGLHQHPIFFLFVRYRPNRLFFRCLEGWTGAQCEKPSSTESEQCRKYCHNGGRCYFNSNKQLCACTSDYQGDTCTELRDPQVIVGPQGGVKEGGRSIWIPIAWALAVILIVLAIGLIAFEYVFRRRAVFSHERLQENDFNNPIYQDRDAEPFALDADKVNIS